MFQNKGQVGGRDTEDKGARGGAKVAKRVTGVRRARARQLCLQCAFATGRNKKFFKEERECGHTRLQRAVSHLKPKPNHMAFRAQRNPTNSSCKFRMEMKMASKKKKVTLITSEEKAHFYFTLEIQQGRKVFKQQKKGELSNEK